AGDIDGDGYDDLLGYLNERWVAYLAGGSEFEVSEWMNLDDTTTGAFSCGLEAGYGNAGELSSNTAELSNCVSLELEAGYHDITVWGRTFDKPGALRLAYAGPDTGGILTLVPEHALSHYTLAALVEETFTFDAPGDDNTN